MQKSAEYLRSLTTERRVSVILAYPLIFLIYLYRCTLSPIFGNSCRFYPSCSYYAEEALFKYGLFRGVMYAARRLLRCHPWHEGGYDPVE